MAKLPTQETLIFRHRADKDFRHYIVLLEHAWEKGDFDNVREIARSLMHFANESKSAWNDGKPAWTLKEQDAERE